MKPNPPHHRLGRTSRNSGFTLVEILVTVVIIAAIVAIVVNLTRSIRTSASKVTDMNNLRNLATAAMAAGNDSAGRLPQIHDPNSLYPYYLVSREKLEAAGIFKESCYAPTRNVMGGAPTYEWWYRNPTNTPVHYVYCANDATLPTGAWFLKNGKVTPPDRSEYRGGIPYDTIIADKTKAFARTVTDDAWYGVLWVGICRDYGGSKVAALMNDGEPLGVNAMYLDGHAEWVPWEKMKPRYNGGGVVVYF
jgi:prepilin-type N-terminal cleavage/methylation domain-containing protein/prepilin-type processing-associated H-X9-DG protein